MSVLCHSYSYSNELVVKLEPKTQIERPLNLSEFSLQKSDRSLQQLRLHEYGQIQIKKSIIYRKSNFK